MRSADALPPVLSACEPDRELYCQDKTDVADVNSCILAHARDLSKVCQQALERYMQMRNEATERGGGALSSFGGLNAMGPPIPLFSYEGRMSSGGVTPSFTDSKANISSPVFKTPTQTVALSLLGSDLHLGAPITLSSGTVLPTELYRIETGVQYFSQLEDKKSWGLRASFGYAGDVPFLSNGTAYSLSAHYGYPSGDGSGYWLLSLFISDTSPFGKNIPIPGFGYIYRSPTFNGLFGFPITSMQWTPVFPWSFSLSLFGPTLQSEAGYGVIQKVQFFTGYSWTMQAYIPSQVTNSQDRLTIQEMKATAGFRGLLWPSVLGEFQAGRAFNRSIYIGNGLFNQEGGYATIADDWFVLLSLKAKL